MRKNTIKLLRNRIWLILVGSFYAFILTTLWIVYLMAQMNTQDTIYQMLNSRLASSELFFEETFFTVEMNEAGELSVINSNFNLLLDSYIALLDTALSQPPGVNQFSYQNQTWAYTITGAGEEVLTQHLEAGQKVLFVDIADNVNQLSHLLVTLQMIGVASFFIGLLASFMLANQFIKPTKMAFEKESELRMAQKRFTANASHELRTPLTLIKGSCEEILSHPEQTIASQHKWFDMMTFSIKRMEQLTADLLTLARLDEAKDNWSKEVVNMSELVCNVAKVMQIAADSKGVVMTTSVRADVNIHSNKEKMQQVLLILFDNAIKYVDEKGVIEIELSKAEGKAIVVIANSGRGISETDLPKLFERFYRGETTSDKVKGSGLGLAIAKELTHQVGGDIFIESRVQGKTMVTIALPEK